MNICFFSGDITRSGETERATLLLANALVQRDPNYTIHILSLENENEEVFFEVDPAVQLASILNNPAINGHKSKFATISGRIRRYVLENEIDIFIDVDTILSLYSLPALANIGTKHVAWEQFSFNQNLDTRLRTWGRKLASNYSDAIVVSTEKDQENFLIHLGINRPIYQIYHPIGPVKSPQSNHYNKDSKIILSAGPLTHQKGFDLLLDAASDVFKKHPDWEWWILGDGEDRDALQAKIERRGLDQQVKLLGHVSNMEEYYKKAAMFVSTSRFEPAGLALTEAKALDLPCISFDVESAPSEIISDGINGYLIEPFNTKKMAGAINYLIENSDERKRLSSQALKDTEKFDLEQIVDQWEDLFHHSHYSFELQLKGGGYGN